MSWKRQMQNYEAKERDKREHSAARWALERFRSSGDASGFSDLRWWLYTHSFEGHRHWSLAGFRFDDMNPRLTQEEYDRMKVAWLETEKGKVDTWKIPGW